MKRKGTEITQAGASVQPNGNPQQNKTISKPSIFKARDQKPVYSFIDASNLFWGGRESIGFGIDYKKLKEYLEKNYGVTKIFYYGGVRIFDFEYSILGQEKLDFQQLADYLKDLQSKSGEEDKISIEKSLNKINFYQILEGYGYDMKIKPAKVYHDEDDENGEKTVLKANCDVDMTFDLMRYMEQYSGVVVMTGDGDFAAVLNYLKNHDRTVTIFSRNHRTAKEIREIAGDNFVDFENLKNSIKLHY
jgi:uncharacterized LabA/DUF88 family protein